MDDYITNLRVKIDHSFPAKPQHYPYKITLIAYSAKIQYAAGPNNSPPLKAAGITRIQSIVGALIYYAQSINNKIILSLSELSQKQGSATEATNNTINQPLNYVATYPTYGITFRTSVMVLAGHSDAAYPNAIKAHSIAGAHIMMSEDVPAPTYNVPVLTISSIIKCVMSSAAEAKLAALYICAKEMVPLFQALVEMGWPHSQSPIQCDNLKAIGVANETIIPRKINSNNMQFHWLPCRDAQGQLRYFWALGPNNLTNCITKNNPVIYHLSKQKTRKITV